MQILQEANAKRDAKPGFMARMFAVSKEQKFEELADMYNRAANQFKMAKEFQMAGDAFMEAGRCKKEIGTTHEMAMKASEAATCYKKVNFDLYTSALEECIAIYEDMGKFSMAAKQLMNIAEIAEKEHNKFEEACELYNRAAEYFEGEDQQSSVNKAKLRIAHLKAHPLKEFDAAAEEFEQLGDRYIESNLLKFSAKELYMKAGLCHLATGDYIAAERAHETYSQKFSQFVDTREEKLLKDILEALNEGDLEAFQQTIGEWDAISKFDAWMTGVMLVIKKNLEGADDLC